MKSMTGMTPSNKPIVTENELVFANELNTFSRFESVSIDSIDKCADILDSIMPSEEDRIVISEEVTRRTFLRLNSKKAPGPDQISPLIL